MAAKKKSPKKPQERNLTRELSLLLAKTLLPDLQARAQEPSVARALAAQYESERKHTADSLAEWTTRTLEQVAVAWILSCVFIRTLEDRGYLTHPRLAGEGAADSEHLFFDLFPSLTQRDYLLAVFRELSHLPGGEEVLAPKHNPAWRLAPTTEAVRTLLAFFREADSEGKLVWAFAGESTRFLGDLYQNVSEVVRERYALLQTPEFVEEFILDLTLDPAVAEFGLEEVRLIDPTCGSGHFLLGAFERLFEARQRKAPATAAKEHAGAALAQVYGADINPYAAGIARFRLVLAYLQAAGIERLRDAPRISTNVVVADSLLFAADNQTLPFAAIAEDATAWGDRHWQFEDPKEVQRIFSKRFHAIVGNPPYITCKDSVLRDAYRELYKSCYRGFSLAAPFTERFFQLATDGGFVGMINANSFMKREFGKALIETVLPQFELTRVMDTAGAFIPGHGTPTILLFGRRRLSSSGEVVAVLGKRGEPSTPESPQDGLVWSSIKNHFDQVGFENEYVSITAVRRDTFYRHPWSLGGGGAAELKELIESRASMRLSQVVEEIGFGAVTREDDLYLVGDDVLRRKGISKKYRRALVAGENVRDWDIRGETVALWPYESETMKSAQEPSADSIVRLLWPYRTQLSSRVAYGKTQLARGLQWHEYSMFFANRFRTPLTIAFAFVATHNHFVLDRGGKVFNRTAPIIKLAETATEEDHLALLAYLNSSTACFWMKQTMMNKGGSGVGRGVQDEGWEARFEFDGTKMATIPLPNLGGLHVFASQMEEATTASRLAIELGSDAAYHEALSRMVAIQEKLDVEVYQRFGLLESPVEIPERIAPGERLFELDLIRSDKPTAWFERNKYSRPTPVGAARVLPDELRLIEQPEYKRRWTVRDPADSFKGAQDGGFLLTVEESLRVRVQPTSARALVPESGKSEPGGQSEQGCALLVDESVAFLAGYRYSDSGLVKRSVWERVWDLQRREDAGERPDVPLPPKYDSKDFRDPTYWRLRGKLDIPKERFISYPGAEKDDDKSPLFGWAGWDHLQQATALAGLYHERKTEDGWPADRLVPLLAGLLELVPWLKQWHNDPNDELGGEGPGDWYERYVEAESRSIGKTVQDLRDWRPAKGRGSKAS